MVFILSDFSWSSNELAPYIIKISHTKPFLLSRIVFCFIQITQWRKTIVDLGRNGFKLQKRALKTKYK
ncbi:MAG: hypothetical protein BGN96_15400 [Bacteroidales bacterium 45-6]|nr:MAG: hypothetical protein BGN96_15400 [Bacteroidales bacterium 45-6]